MLEGDRFNLLEENLSTRIDIQPHMHFNWFSKWYSWLKTNIKYI